MYIAKTKGYTPAPLTCKLVPGCKNPPLLDRNGKNRGQCAEHSQRRVGDRRIDKQGYVHIWTEHGRVFEHRLVMEAAIGRKLTQGETVHHINGDRADNRPENLELWHSAQPYGQRVSDLINYVVTHHREEVERRLAD